MNIDKYIYDENNGLWYELQGDYYIPCLTLPEKEQQPIGVWGQRHLRYVREYQKGLYNTRESGIIIKTPVFTEKSKLNVGVE